MKRMMIAVAMVLVMGAGLAWGQIQINDKDGEPGDGFIKWPNPYQTLPDGSVLIDMGSLGPAWRIVDWAEIEEALRLADIIASRSLVCVEARDAEKIREVYKKVKEINETWGVGGK